MQRVGYHDFEGIVSNVEERERMLAAMGDKPALILRNHGLLTAAPTIAGAFIMMIFLDRACQLQLNLHQSGQKLIIPPDDVCRHTASQYWSESGPAGHIRASGVRGAQRLASSDKAPTTRTDGQRLPANVASRQLRRLDHAHPRQARTRCSTIVRISWKANRIITSTTVHANTAATENIS